VEATVGYLCIPHAVAIACPHLSSEQIRSRATAPATPPDPAGNTEPGIALPVAVGALVDPWGTAHPISETATIGRDPDSDLAILHPSVSSKHATLSRRVGSWVIVDQQSRNGTSVDDRKVEHTLLAPRSRVRFGEVSVYFCDQPLAALSRPTGPGRTAPTRREQIVFGVRVTTSAGQTVELSQRIDGGVARVAGSVIELARMEFALIQMLAERRRSAPDAELAYVAWHEIADALSFRSVDADSENVRELVRRVRKKLGAAQIDDLIESKQGVGYRLRGNLD
jgi:pSer/pThr/pTyr-binding forkhead associated (FHA) protein